MKKNILLNEIFYNQSLPTDVHVLEFIIDEYTCTIPWGWKVCLL